MTFVVSSDALADLKAHVSERVAVGDQGDKPQEPPYPSSLPATYQERLEAGGALRYAAFGVARDDWASRRRVRARNWECWGATTALFIYIDSGMLAPQWMDLGVYLSHLMLLFRAEGIDTCAQIAWAEYHETVAEALSPPSGHVLACGMSVGYRDPSVRCSELPREDMSQMVTFRS